MSSRAPEGGPAEISPELERFLDACSKTVHGCLLLLDPAGRVCGASAALFDVEPEQAVGRMLDELLGADATRELREPLSAVRAGVGPVTTEITLRGQRRVVRVAAADPDWKDVSTTVHIEATADIDERRREFLDMLLELNADLVYAFRIDDQGQGHVEWTTRPNAESSRGLPSLQVSPGWMERVHPDDAERVRAWGDRALSSNDGRECEYRVCLPGGEVRWMRSRLRARRRRPGEPLRGVGMSSDVTDRKRLEEELRMQTRELEAEVARRTRELAASTESLQQAQERLLRVERTRTAEDLAASLAHTINNPLAALLGNLQLMAEASESPDPRLLRGIHLSKRIRAVVDRTLQLFRKGTLDLGFHQPADLVEEARGELAESARDSDVELAVEIDPDLPQVQVDGTLLVAALVALGENAVEAMPGGGRLLLEARAIPGVSAISFRVSDTGPGIHPELRDKVLEPYFTTKGGGTGLGLAIARGVVQGHEGRMRIESARGGGAVIVVEIPL